MFNNILCPTDLSPRAEMAVKKAVQMAHQFNSKITLLNVHEEFMNKDEMEMLRVSVEKMQDKFKEIALSAREDMKTLIHKLHAEDIEVAFLLKEGKSSSSIIETAKSINADLIVIGTNGKPSLSEFILGTTAEYVVRHSECPVLVVPNAS
ncbi:MAG: universal stress protein [Candidatus Marinimicrobia bacterium]|nr:universal stress protein [Candidatus Neomarinimicrobiota bacterium]MBL7022993.1 universal stress protein [Candidatus Neomarinimicrobiota bacterium]